jgi:hypothetical protein
MFLIKSDGAIGFEFSICNFHDEPDRNTRFVSVAVYELGNYFSTVMVPRAMLGLLCDKRFFFQTMFLARATAHIRQSRISFLSSDVSRVALSHLSVLFAV